MQKRFSKIQETIKKILDGEFPRYIGEKDMLEECAERARALAVLALVNNEPAYLINSMVDQADDFTQKAYCPDLKEIHSKFRMLYQPIVQEEEVS